MKSSSSMRPLTTGTALSASTHALIKNDIKPSLTLFFFVNLSCDFARNSCTALMSHSLKVVRMAAVCCAITSCAAILRRSGDILLRVNRPSDDWRSCSAREEGKLTASPTDLRSSAAASTSPFFPFLLHPLSLPPVLSFSPEVSPSSFPQVAAWNRQSSRLLRRFSLPGLRRPWFRARRPFPRQFL